MYKFLVFALLVCPIVSIAQHTNAQPDSIVIVNADSFNGAGRMKGNVILKIDGRVVHCDSASVLNNELMAFNFTIQKQNNLQPPSTTVSGDQLQYKNNDHIAYLAGNIHITVDDNARMASKQIMTASSGQVNLQTDKYIFKDIKYNK